MCAEQVHYIYNQHFFDHGGNKVGDGGQIRDPIHGMITLNNGELEIVNHHAFQRLRHIRQLAMTYKVYPGATHTRFEHCLGVMHLAGRMMDSLGRRPIIKDRFNNDEFSRLKQAVRLTGLLHDVGHAPFSHGGEGIFPSNIEHENYSIAIIKKYFSPIIKRSFPKVRVAEIISLLSKGYLSAEKVFLGSIINGEMDADKLDYLLRDSHYCGVSYGKYDLERILDTLTVVRVKETEESVKEQDTNPGVWQLGIDSDGVQAVEGLIFARYWMFIQVYFHKTRRIYDYFLTEFLKDYLQKDCEGAYPNPDKLESFLRLDDNTVLEAIKEKHPSNDWARRIYLRKHLSEAFVTPTHHTGLESFLIVKELNGLFNQKYKEGFVDDKASKMPTNPLFGLKKQEDGGEQEQKYASIIVRDKHDPERHYSIFDVSLPLRLLSEKKINIVRFYVPRNLKEEASRWCQGHWDQISAKVKKIGEGGVNGVETGSGVCGLSL